MGRETAGVFLRASSGVGVGKHEVEFVIILEILPSSIHLRIYVRIVKTFFLPRPRTLLLFTLVEICCLRFVDGPR